VIFFGTVTFCFELLDEEVCELDAHVVRSVCGLPSGSGKSDVSSSDESASSAIAVVGVNKLQTQCVVVGRRDQKTRGFLYNVNLNVNEVRYSKNPIVLKGNSWIFPPKNMEVNSYTFTPEWERTCIDRWDWMVQSHGIPTLMMMG